MTTTWSATNKAADAQLSNGNLTVTPDALTPSGNNVMGRSDATITTGDKKYFETTIDLDAAQSTGIGVCNSSLVFTNLGDWLGAQPYGYGYYGDSNVYQNYNGTSTPVASLATFTTGDVIGVAIDFTNAEVWWRVNGGNWNNSGTANPATNTGGVSLSALGAGPWYPAYTVYYDGFTFSKSTTNFGATTFAHAAPSGFTGFDSSGITGNASITEGADALASAGAVAIKAAAAITEGTDTLAAAGTVAVKAAAAITEGADSLAAAGRVAVGAAAAITEGADTLTAAGTTTGAITGNASITEGGDTLSATGTGGVVVPFQGAGSGGRRGKKKGKAGKKARRGLFSDEPVEEPAVAEMAPTNDVDEDEEDAIMLLLLAA